MFWKGEDFHMAMEKFWIFVWKNSILSLNGYNLVSYLTPYVLWLLIYYSWYRT